ncbi:MAG: amidohydrolase family protein [Acidobacteriota bacterium]|nr:amidohydrolase family protein [Blastocatellia bacterium]MDW8238283.1 amidohydrolase family protein [Acidobacteriota bacterium]
MRTSQGIVSFVSLTLILSFQQVETGGDRPHPIVIEGGTLIDGTGGPVMENAVVVVHRNKIAAVGRKGSIAYPKAARVIRADGKFILPGLIDGHVHYDAWHGELTLAHGVTTVKDTGNPVEWLKALSAALDEGLVRGPRLFYTGNSLTAPPALRDHHIGLESPQMARRAVRLLKENGAIAIKVHQQITLELLRVVADEAHKLGLRVTGHIRRLGAIQAALAGIDALEHSTGVARSTGPNAEFIQDREPENELTGYYDDLNEMAEMKPENFARLIRLLVEKKVAIQPTLVTYFRIASDHRQAYAQEDAMFARNENLRYVPDEVRKLWRTSVLFEPKSPEERDRFRRAYRNMSRFLKQFHDAGGKLLVGSSTSVMVPGRSLHREMEMMVELGLSPGEVIRMTTQGNAEFLRKEKELGTIAAGKFADLIIVKSNPLDDIKNIQQVELVIKNGKEVDTSYNPDYAMPIPRPQLERPVWLEQQLKREARGKM